METSVSEAGRTSHGNEMLPNTPRTQNALAHEDLHASEANLSMPADGSSLDWSAMVNTIESQQWLTPTGFPWDQWNSYLDSSGMDGIR